MSKKLLIITSDERQKHIASYLKKLNYIIYENNEYVKGNFDAIVLPMSYKNIKQVITDAKNTLVIGGNISGDDFDFASEKNVQLYDYFNNETVKYENAFLTAEAAVNLAITNTKKSIKSCKCLIIGFGRIGKMLTKLIKSFESDITVSARKDTDIALINVLSLPFKNTENLKDISDYDLIFNTVPFLILNDAVLKTAKKDVLIIDLASKPGGTDFNSAKSMNINCIHALALPSKFSPETDAEILGNSILKILTERS